MQDEVRAATAGELQPGDIIFECPQCTKSLAIDVRGAGYVVRCPDCQTEIIVPGALPPEEPAAVEQAASAEPESEAAQLAARLAHVERLRALDAARHEQISGELALIQASLDRLVGLLADAQNGKAEG